MAIFVCEDHSVGDSVERVVVSVCIILGASPPSIIIIITIIITLYRYTVIHHQNAWLKDSAGSG